MIIVIRLSRWMSATLDHGHKAEKVSVAATPDHTHKAEKVKVRGLV